MVLQVQLCKPSGPSGMVRGLRNAALLHADQSELLCSIGPDDDSPTGATHRRRITANGSAIVDGRR